LRDLSLHLLDLTENAIRAGADTVRITVREDRDGGLLHLCVEDDGPGLEVPTDTAMDPFYTTGAGKRTGLGLGLFGAAAERAGGSLSLERSALGGLAVRATLGLEHVDRQPLGDLPATLASVALANPGLHLICSLRTPVGACELSSRELAEAMPPEGRDDLAIAQALRTQVREALARLALQA